MVSKKNPLNEISVEELKAIWSPGSKVKTWNAANKKWAAQPIKLYGPGPDSGTFDYFTKAVNGKEKASRSDYVASEDDNVVVRGVSEDPNAMGYFGYAYYIENQKKLFPKNWIILSIDLLLFLIQSLDAVLVCFFVH